MAVVSASTNPELFPTYYEKKIVEFVKENLPAIDYGQVHKFQPNMGKTAKFTRFIPIALATTPLTNSPTPALGANITVQQVDVTMQEYGNYIELDEFSDVTSFTPLLDNASTLLAYNAQQSLNKLAINEITAGTNVIYADSVADRSSLTGSKYMSKSDIRKAVNTLQKNNIQPFADGYYVMFIHPDKLLNIFTDSEFITLALAKPEGLGKGVITEVFGAKIITSTSLPIVSNGGTPSKDVYLSVVFGSNAYGVVPPDSDSLKMTMTNIDKLGRIKTPGWKAYFTAKRLYEPAIVRIESN